MTTQQARDANGVIKYFEGTGTGSDSSNGFTPTHQIGDGTNKISVETTSANAESNTKNRVPVISWLKLFNGTSWDMLLGGLVGLQTTFTGILNSIPMLRYNASAPTASDGNILPFQGDINGNLKTVLQAGETHYGEVGGNSAVKSGTLTRPNDTSAYASGDLIANSTTAGSVVPITLAVSRVNDRAVIIPRIRLKKTTTSITNASFRVHLYKSSPTVTNGDNGAILTTESNHIGYVDVTMDRVFSDAAKGVGVPSVGSQFIIEPDTGTQNIYALIEARAAYTPGASEVFTVSAECLRD